VPASNPSEPTSLRNLIAIAFGGHAVATITETADALRCGRDTIHRWINDGKLTTSRVGGRRLVHVTSIQKLLEETTDHSRRPRAPRKAPTGKVDKQRDKQKPHSIIDA
jgi:excisionase family DNA binding protein